MLRLLTFLLFGLLWGARHSVEPDHIAAISLFSSTSGTKRESMKRALLWSGGHMLSMFAIVILFFIFQIQLPARIIGWAETLMGGLLALFGLYALSGFVKGRPKPQFSGASSFVIGIGHGIAGSGLVLFALVSFAYPRYAVLLYVLFFGIGMAASMAAIGILVHSAVEYSERSEREGEAPTTPKSGVVGGGIACPYNSALILKISALVALVTGVLMIAYSGILSRP